MEKCSTSECNELLENLLAITGITKRGHKKVAKKVKNLFEKTPKNIRSTTVMQSKTSLPTIYRLFQQTVHTPG